jgi:hypothetical protein
VREAMFLVSDLVYSALGNGFVCAERGAFDHFA